MKIETLFNVNDILQYKFQGTNPTSCFEVIEIVSVTCSAGTQVFYKVRPINFEYETDWKEAFKKEEGEGDVQKPPKRIKKLIGATPYFVKDNVNAYFQLREDELVAASQQIKDLLESLRTV